MTKTLIALLIALLLSNETVLAQTSNQTIFEAKRSSGTVYLMGEKEFTKDEIKDKLIVTPSSMDLIVKSNSKSRWGNVIFITGMIATSLIISDLSRVSNGSNESIAIFALVIGADLAGLMLIRSSQRDFNKAIKKYNESIISSESSIKLNIGMQRIGFTIQL